jgi:glycerol-1-phosphate dehydrogenase [NAD(P)+]
MPVSSSESTPIWSPVLRCGCAAESGEPVGTVEVSRDGLQLASDFCRQHHWQAVIVVADPNTYDACAQSLLGELSSARISAKTEILGLESKLRPELSNAEMLTSTLRRRAPQAVIAVGSGTICDLCRYAADRCGIPLVAVATAASMDGYASSVSALTAEGLRLSFAAKPPVAIFADTQVIADAPPEMRLWGLGDLLAKATALTDWLLSHHLYGEPICIGAIETVKSALHTVLSDLAGLLDNDASSVVRLLQALLATGQAMATVGSSRPASGSEHLLSHLLDLLSSAGKIPGAPHGIQAGYATHLCIPCFQVAFSEKRDHLNDPALRVPPSLDLEATWLFGPRVHDLASIHAQKQSWLENHAPTFQQAKSRWPEIRLTLEEACSIHPEVSQALLAAGLADPLPLKGIGEDLLAACVRQADRIRTRYGVLDFLWGQQAMQEATSSIFS